MHSAETHPTPQYVIDVVCIVAHWLCVIDAAEALISLQGGGVAWHAERQADRAQTEILRLLQRDVEADNALS